MADNENALAETADTNLLEENSKLPLPQAPGPLFNVAAAGESGPVNQGGGGNKGN